MRARRQAMAAEQDCATLPPLTLEITHDLKEPLRTIVCCAELLAKKRGTVDDDMGRLLKYVTEAAKRMQRMIDDALAFASLNTAECEKTRFNIADVLQFAVSNLRETTARAGAVVTKGPLPVVAANFGALAQVFQNLIGNAIKYRSDRVPRIHVSCSRSDDGWVISVADNGIGIEQRYIEQIFQPLQRLHSQDQIPGSGLGLAICKRIIDSHKGRIWAESKPGTGSTFYFTLPAVPDQPTEPIRHSGQRSLQSRRRTFLPYSQSAAARSTALSHRAAE